MRTLVCVLTMIGLICALTVITTQDCQAMDDDDTRVLYLPFDGADPEDMSQYGHDVELVGDPEHVDGRIGKAYSVSPSNYVKVPINDTLQLVEKFTVEFWVNREAAQPATWNYMVAGGSLKWAVIVNSNQNVYVWSRSGGNWGQRLVTTIPLPAEEWVHIAMTYDVDSGVELYFNGEEKAGEGVEPPVVDEIDGSIMVGARHPGQEFFAGIIDEVALYNRVLSLDEIQRDMEAVGGAAVEPSSKLAVTWGDIKK